MGKIPEPKPFVNEPILEGIRLKEGVICFPWVECDLCEQDEHEKALICGVGFRNKDADEILFELDQCFPQNMLFDVNEGHCSEERGPAICDINKYCVNVACLLMEKAHVEITREKRRRNEASVFMKVGSFASGCTFEFKEGHRKFFEIEYYGDDECDPTL